MLKSVGNNTQGQGLHLLDSLFATAAINEIPWQVGNGGNPASVFFLLRFHL